MSIKWEVSQFTAIEMIEDKLIFAQVEIWDRQVQWRARISYPVGPSGPHLRMGTAETIGDGFKSAEAAMHEIAQAFATGEA